MKDTRKIRNYTGGAKVSIPLFDNKTLVDYLGIWFLFTIFLSALPLLFKVSAYIILSKSLILNDLITEILFLFILLYTDSIRVIQMSREKSAISSLVFFLDIPAVIISMFSYGFFSFSQYTNYQIVGFNPKVFLIAIGAGALLFDISAQVLYIVQGNLSYSDGLEISGSESEDMFNKVLVRIAKSKVQNDNLNKPTDGSGDSTDNP